MSPIQPTTISLSTLQTATVPLPLLTEAFSPSSLGILLVRVMPPHFSSLRTKVLKSASRLAQLPAHKLDKLVNKRAKYLVGWSHGVETLGESGRPDRGKGSFYVNCGFYNDGRRSCENGGEDGGGEEDGRWAGFEEYTAPNIWPSETDPEDDLRDFRADLEELVAMIIDVAVLVARACDQYAAVHVEGYPRPTVLNGFTDDDAVNGSLRAVGYLERIVSSSRTTKARLLHYFPSEDPDGQAGTEDKDTDEGEDGWCATHVDHGCLTGLTSAMFLDETSPSSLSELPTSPDPAAGLYIRSRAGETVKVSIPRDCLAFQTGGALELVTKGRFKAVPHFVKGVSRSRSDEGSWGGGRARIARNTLAVFTQPNLGEIVDQESGLNFGEFAKRVVEDNTL